MGPLGLAKSGKSLRREDTLLQIEHGLDADSRARFAEGLDAMRPPEVATPEEDEGG